MSETLIIGLAGKKGSGKNTVCNMMAGWILKQKGLVGDYVITEKGMLELDGAIVNLMDKDVGSTRAASKIVKVYSFADPLKELCMNLLGCTREQCYGTDEQKNTLTKIKWENFPGYTGEKTGLMTARELMQHVGSGIFRRMNDNIWVEACINRIKKDGPELALICDCRFPNEVEGIHEAKGKVMRLTRNVLSADTHISETALDDYKGFDKVIDNKDISLGMTNILVTEYLNYALSRK